MDTSTVPACTRFLHYWVLDLQGQPRPRTPDDFHDAALRPCGCGAVPWGAGRYHQFSTRPPRVWTCYYPVQETPATVGA